jgi:hypothetical protein
MILIPFTALITSRTKGASMKRRDDIDLARFAADAMVLILFFVALTCIIAFACALYFFLWLVGIV